MRGTEIEIIANVIVRADLDTQSKISLVAEFCRALPYTSPWFNPDQFINSCRLTPGIQEGVYARLDLPDMAKP